MLCGTMRRYYLLILASLQICRARQPGFSIHDDMLAYPQVRVASYQLPLLFAQIGMEHTDKPNYSSR